MIIQCRRCETRYRFDESLIDGDGVWVRCTRCQHVFFEERPAGEQVAARPTDVPSVVISDAKRTPPEEAAAEKPLKADISPGREEAQLSENGRDVTVGEVEMSPEETKTEGEREEAAQEEAPVRRRWGRTLAKAILVVFVILALAAGGAVWLLPELREQAVDFIGPWLRDIPGLEKVLEKAPTAQGTPAPVQLVDVRQRSVTNLLAGTLRVIEGVAVNHSPHTIARIKIRLVISDAYDVILGEKIVYCGNILSDGELNTLAESEIYRELSTPNGTDVSNERIPPKGSIPFMIVFSQEGAGAIKTVVMPAGAEKVQ